MKISAERAVTTALSAGILILAALGGFAYTSMLRLAGTAAAVGRTHRLLQTVEATYAQIADAETGSRGYALTGEALYLRAYEGARRALPARLRVLRTLTVESPRQSALFGRLDSLVTRRLAAIDRTVELRQEGGVEAAAAYLRTGRGKALMDSVRAVVDEFERQQEAILAEYSRGQDTSLNNVALAIMLGITLALVVSALAAAMVRRELAARAADERALRAAKEAAEGASRAKTEFLARMSHELRTPLNSVIGFSNVLLRRQAAPLGDDGRKFLERIRDNGMHLLMMINDILDISRIEVGRVLIERRTVALDDLVRDVVGGFEEEARSRGLALRCDVPDGLAPVETDAGRLRQVLVNLVTNALKFTERGGVEVRVLAAPDSGVPACIEVADTGIGIPADRQAAVFEAFEQADTSTERRYGGTGLGLAISHALCDLLGYRLTLASEPGVGSTFSVLLSASAPRRERPDAPDPAAERLAEPRLVG